MTPITSTDIGSAALGRADAIEPSSGQAGDFATALGRAVSSVDQLQVAADQQATSLAEGGGNLHETSLALGKAEVGMHLMLKIRDKVVDAYQQIMQMSI